MTSTPSPDDRVWRLRYSDDSVVGLFHTLAEARDRAGAYPNVTIGCWDTEDPNRWVPAPIEFVEPHVLQWGDKVTFGNTIGRFVGPHFTFTDMAVILAVGACSVYIDDLTFNGLSCVLPEVER